MRQTIRTTACALGALLALAAPALAGDGWRHRDARPWYDQPPLAGTGPGFYYSQHPDHVPGYPDELSGLAVPIYESRNVSSATAWRYEGEALHAAWCADRHRTYRESDDTYRSASGARKVCRSPYR